MRHTFVALLLLYLCPITCIAQEQPASNNEVPQLPPHLLSRIQKKLFDLNANLEKGTESYLKKVTERENQLKEKIQKIDPVGAKLLFSNSSQKYSESSKNLRQTRVVNLWQLPESIDPTLIH
jgi:hypothetical protein